MKGLLISSLLFIFVLSGCSVKVYESPSIDLMIKDKQTKLPVQGAELKRACLVGEKVLATSNEEGEVSYEGVYERRWHMYPFPIPTYGALAGEHLSLCHHEYSNYTIKCLFTSLGGKCFSFEMQQSEKEKKEMLFK